jgi:2-desacetyl-2-hydroxyethyl bacteriochlorophyllide A dehydrogenase
VDAIEVREPGSLRLHETRNPTPGHREVLVEVELVGICGTDIHLFDGDFPTVRYPARPGHEVTGVVADVGHGVMSLERGTRVCVDPGVPCLHCSFCQAGRHNLCANRRAIGISLPGGAADFVVVPEVNCYPISETVRPEQAVLCEPLACVIHAIDRVPSGPAVNRALIYGAGTIGLLTTQLLDHLGALAVDIVDPNEERRTMAAKLTTGEVTAYADAHGPHARWDLVVDASGSPAAIEDGIGRVRAGGTYVQLGVAPNRATVAVEPYELFARELILVGSMTTSYSFPRAVRFIESGIVDVSGFAGTSYPLERYDEALRAARSGREIKTVVDLRRDVP